ncbi:MAG TPA: hypothetical protein VGE52_02945 [Pirellulales bacterium]
MVAPFDPQPPLWAWVHRIFFVAAMSREEEAGEDAAWAQKEGCDPILAAALATLAAARRNPSLLHTHEYQEALETVAANYCFRREWHAYFDERETLADRILPEHSETRLGVIRRRETFRGRNPLIGRRIAARDVERRFHPDNVAQALRDERISEALFAYLVPRWVNLDALGFPDEPPLHLASDARARCWALRASAAAVEPDLCQLNGEAAPENPDDLEPAIARAAVLGSLLDDEPMLEQWIGGIAANEGDLSRCSDDPKFAVLTARLLRRGAAVLKGHVAETQALNAGAEGSSGERAKWLAEAWNRWQEAAHFVAWAVADAEGNRMLFSPKPKDSDSAGDDASPGEGEV